MKPVPNPVIEIDEQLLGFDARKMWLDPMSHWPVERRTIFLLREDVGPILSTDEFVWPSVFQTDQWPVATETQLEEHGLTGPERPQWTGLNAPLWESLKALRTSLAVHGAATHRPYWIVAVTMLSAGQQERPPHHGPKLGATDPDAISLSWTFLGYDVADGSFVSGLTNCGYTPEQKEHAARRWSASLNAYHLFESAEAANEFRPYADERVAEHAPFWVYGLYWIAEVPSAA